MKLPKLGGKLYLVGGAVRDSLMGRAASDRDYVLVGVPLEKVPFTKIAGKDFPVFLVDGVEIAMARREKKVSAGYHGFEFYTGPEITIEQDLLRRDLTINAMARAEDGTLIDPYGGADDIDRRLLRHTSDAFKEDPLRVYRVARFAAQLGFDVHPSTRQMMLELKVEMATLTPERVGAELLKALAAPYPDRFFRELDGMLDVHMPEVQALKIPDKHDGTAFEHTMSVIGRGVGVKERFALLCHDLGKGISTAPPVHHGHQKHTHLIEALSQRLKVPKKLMKFAVKFMGLHMKVKGLHEMRHGKLFRMLDKDLPKILRLSFLESGTRYSKEVYVSHCRLVRAASEVVAEVDGAALIGVGVVPDASFGEKLLQARIKALRRKI